MLLLAVGVVLYLHHVAEGNYDLLDAVAGHIGWDDGADAGARTGDYRPVVNIVDSGSATDNIVIQRSIKRPALPVLPGFNAIARRHAINHAGFGRAAAL